MERLKHPSHHRCWVEIDLNAIAENVRRFRQAVGPTVEVMCCLKANAYGHGAKEVAPAVLAAGAQRLAVATCEEGEELRAAGISAPLHILGASLPEEVEPAVARDLVLSIHEIGMARIISLEARRQNKIASVHLKIDTGMGRLGILPADAPAAAQEIARFPNLRLEGVFMHFAEAGDEAYSRHQLGQFQEALRHLAEAGVRVPLRHAANSVASILYPEARFDLIRPGAGIYGYHSPAWVGKRFPLVPALSWKCLVVQIKDYPEGSHLGYNRTFTTRRPTRVAVLPVGYADGYARAISNRGWVLIRGRRAPVVGMISMDYTMVDVTELPEVEVGSVATLLGRDDSERLTAEEVAEFADTIPYCVTTGIGRRPGRY
ncbi:MAG: alanine racemase, partial [Planctomycetota bacterium]|nr:alanine racemase [Planctomycetota bacterium]